nr:hypothetical protein [Tanacetum cinerariifolium]
MVAKHERGITPVKDGGKKKTTPKADKPRKPAPAKQAKPATAKQPTPKPVKEKPTKPTPIQKAGKEVVPEPQGAGEEYDLERAIQMSLESFQAQGQAHVGGVAIREPVAEATLPLPVIEGKGKAIAMKEQRRTSAIKEASTRPSAQPQDNTSANIVCESPSPADAKTGVNTDKTNNGGDTEILQIGQAGSDPGKTPESRPPPEQVFIDEDYARPDPEVTQKSMKLLERNLHVTNVSSAG